MQPSTTKKHHAQPAPPPSKPASIPPSDIVIPPPDVTPPPALVTAPSTQMASVPVPAPYVQLGMSSTQIVIAVVLVLVWAGLLLFMKRLLTQSLVTQFADLGRSREAGTALYVFLLVLGATAIVCALGGFWQAAVIIIPAAVLNAVLLVIFLFSFSAARGSRQRR